MNAPHVFRDDEHFDIQITTVDGVTSYIVNGKTYANIEEVPPTARDIIENIRSNALAPGSGAHDSRTFYEVNGVKYDNLEDIPAEYRRIIDKVQALAGEDPQQISRKVSKEVRRYYLDGKEYGSFEEMAPALQKKIEGMIEGPNTTIEYVTTEGVTRKYVDGEETPLRPGEIDELPAALDMEYGNVRQSLPKDELHRRIVINRMQPQDELHELDSFSSPFRQAESSRQAIVKVVGRVITATAYIALILWSQFQPEGFSSYIYAGFLAGDIVSWLVFTVWGWQKNYVEFDYKDLGIRIAGLFFFIILTTRQGAFEVAPHLRNQAVAALVMMAVVAAFAKWTTRMFALIRRITEGF